MKTGRLGLLAVPALLVSAPAAAGEPYYFHKPGVAREAYVEDVTVCRELAAGGRAARTYQPYSNNIYATAAGALLSGFLDSRNRRRHFESIERICMADKGYARITIDEDEFERIRDLDDDAAQLEALFELAAAQEPRGEELPE